MKILTLALLKAYLATHVALFTGNGTNKAGGYQKCNHDTFASFLPNAYNLLNACTESFVKVQCAE